ncbi:MAG: HAD family phosphatase [Bacteroidaceae bacterium]|nr:HAD family phosphatase [Bacteroidaceae bacterium]
MFDNASKSRTFKVALFDLDGTLFDTEDQYTIFWGSMGRRFRPDVPNLEHLIKGTTLKQIFANYFPSPEVQAQILPLLEAYEAQMQYAFFPGVRAFIDDIRRQGVKCAVVTSSDQKKMSNVYRMMPEFQSLFDRVLTAEDFTASKPNPDCYLRGASVFGADISECVVFEDAYTGLEAGMSSGIFTIGVASGHTPEEIADRCNHVITTFEGLDFQKIEEIIRK